MKKKKAFKNFIKTLLITTVLVVLAAVLLYMNIPAEYYTPALPYMIAFFALATLTVYYFMLKATEKRPAKFVNIFMLTTTLKLLIYLAVMLVYALINREDARPFIITFFILYLIYTIVEVVSLLKAGKE
jgi:F0F1-type ATP synthase assembly protein I